MDYQKKLKEYNDFLRDLEDYKDYSEIWDKYRNDFTSSDQILNADGYQRRYGINTMVNNKKIRLFINIYSFLNKSLLKINRKVLKTFSNFLSYLIFGRRDIVNNFRLNYSVDIQKRLFSTYPHYEKSYKRIFNKLSWFYSINSFKSFAFFQRFNDFVDSNQLENQIILEIGSGLCNFCMILMSQLKSFSYICLDIPEMIPNGYFAIKTKYPTNDIDIYLPHEFDSFIKSSSKRKVLFIVPSQLKDLDLKIKLLVNHESFAEMNISTVNNYLNQVKQKLDVNSFVFLVNRLARQNSPRNPLNYNSYTFFDQYDLSGLEVLVKEIDRYRSIFKGKELRENVFFIGKKIS